MHYYAIDFETANEKRNSACALGIVEMNNNKIVNTWDYLINPEDDFNSFNISIHGIHPEDVESEKNFLELWPQIKEILENNLIIAHNASFDISVLRHVLDKYSIPYPNFTYTCTRMLSKKVWPSLFNYKLKTVANHLNIQFNHHQACSDATASALIFEEILKVTNTNNLEDLNSLLKVKSGNVNEFGYKPASIKNPSRINFSQLTPANDEIDPNSTYYQKNICFTGTLSSMSRKEAAQLVVNRGGFFNNGITKKTNYLVMGIQDYSKFANGIKSSKLIKAEEYISKGQDLEIIDEIEFLDLL